MAEEGYTGSQLFLMAVREGKADFKVEILRSWVYTL